MPHDLIDNRAWELAPEINNFHGDPPGAVGEDEVAAGMRTAQPLQTGVEALAGSA